MILSRRTTILLAAGVLIAAGAPAFSAEKKQGDGQPHARNEIEAKATPDYVTLPKIHVAVEVDANRRYRTLDMEVWLHPLDAENMQLANSRKKLIVEAIKEDLAAFNWEAFEDPDGGPQIARRLIEASVRRVSGAKVDDVYIRTLVLR
jgi:hypothetical protein